MRQDINVGSYFYINKTSADQTIAYLAKYLTNHWGPTIRRQDHAMRQQNKLGIREPDPVPDRESKPPGRVRPIQR